MPITLTNRVTASDNQPETGLWFGYSVDIDGEWAIVGYPYQIDTVSGDYSGKVYFYKLENGSWVEKQIFKPTSETAAGGFGSSVAIDGDTAIASYSYTAAGGHIYVFLRTGDTWAIQQIVQGDDTGAGDVFGDSTYGGPRGCDISGDSICASAAGNGVDGACYVLTRTAGVWTQQQKLTPTVAGGTWGPPTVIDGDTIAVGNNLYDDAQSNQGRVDVWTRTAGVWTLQQVIDAKVIANGGQFGWAVDVSGDTLIIGANGLDDPIANVGQVYIYTRDAGVWSWDSTFRAEHYLTETNDDFGWAVWIGGDNALIGARGDENPGDGLGFAGAFYHLKKTDGVWAISERVYPGVDGEIGNSVAMTTFDGRDYFAVGAPSEADNPDDDNQWGYVRFYELGAAFSIASADIAILPMNGGVKVTLTGVFVVGTVYTAHFGLLGTVGDPTCYGGLIGGAYTSQSLDGTTLVFVSPPAARGAGYIATVDDGVLPVSLAGFSVVEQSFYDDTFRTRRHWPAWYSTGARLLKRETRQDD